MARKGGAPGNLRPFVKGIDPRRNLKGPPKVLPELKEALRDKLLQQDKGKTKLENVLDTLYKQAIKGDVRAIQEILDRFYGKAKQEIEVTVPELKVQPMSADEQAEINKSIQMLNESNSGLSEKS
jgi:hypothetical protein